VIEEEVRRPLASPTPLDERADKTYKSAVPLLARMGLDAVRQVEIALDHGEPPDQVAHALVGQGLGPIEAIKALRDGGDMPLETAKEIVHRNLPPDRQAAAEQLWNEAIEALDDRDLGEG
jgi:predicted amidohydrolase YtcJ